VTTIEFVSAGPLVRATQALEARLKLIFPPAKFEHAFMPAKLGKTEWKQLTRRTPFVGLGWNEIEPSKDDGRLFVGPARFTVFLVTKNSSGIRPRYLGDALAPGLFQMVQAAVAAVHGHSVKDLGSFMVTKAGNLAAEAWDEDESAIGGVDVDIPMAMPMRSAVQLTDEELAKTLLTEWKFETPGTLAQDGSLVEPGPAIVEGETLEAA
jgi:hypothetical protein